VGPTFLLGKLCYRGLSNTHFVRTCSSLVRCRRCFLLGHLEKYCKSSHVQPSSRLIWRPKAHCINGLAAGCNDAPAALEVAPGDLAKASLPSVTGPTQSSGKGAFSFSVMGTRSAPIPKRVSLDFQLASVAGSTAILGCRHLLVSNAGHLSRTVAEQTLLPSPSRSHQFGGLSLLPSSLLQMANFPVDPRPFLPPEIVIENAQPASGYQPPSAPLCLSNLLAHFGMIRRF
jgi:hypothetical protein